jgi:hypothetical protein
MFANYTRPPLHAILRSHARGPLRNHQAAGLGLATSPTARSARPVLQRVPYLIMWVVALMRMDSVNARFHAVEAQSSTFTNGTLYASALRQPIDIYL